MSMRYRRWSPNSSASAAGVGENARYETRTRYRPASTDLIVGYRRRHAAKNRNPTRRRVEVCFNLVAGIGSDGGRRRMQLQRRLDCVTSGDADRDRLRLNTNPYPLRIGVPSGGWPIRIDHSAGTQITVGGVDVPNLELEVVGEIQRTSHGRDSRDRMAIGWDPRSERHRPTTRS